MNSLLILLSGIISGMIIFQSALVAPTIFNILSEEQAGPFLRKIFPKLFLTITLLGIFSFVIAIFNEKLLITLIPLTTAILMTICYSLVPMTNRARDDGNAKLFSRLHFVSVSLTVFVLLTNISLVFLI
ncbi:DUF4149 domain-containing protein [SAR86 cluster bacterium]|nr:DUF4149 domain-containing protein [SAR86 cluster bacterium]|tara:strand:- start:2055 stop:2441 length:387 start_codon:yes stop_codon:yes gene_type:complete